MAAPAAPAVPVAHAVRGEHTHSETPIPQPRVTRDASTAVPGAESRRTATGAPGRVPESCEAAAAPSGASEGPHAPGGPGAPDARASSAPGILGGPGRAPASLGAPEAPGAPVAPGAVEAPEGQDGPGAAGGRGTPSGRRVPDARTASVGPVSGPVFAVAAPRPVIQRLSVRGQVLDALRSALVAGDLAPGEVYSAPALGERFGVSATPVREAMQQLANEGAVEVVPNRGFRVIRRGARELAELAEIRALVEMPVMLRLTRTVAAPCWAELRPLAEATVAVAATGDLAGYAESDRVFHAAVLALSGNRQLVQLADDLHRRAQWPMAGVAARRVRGDLLADAVQHTALLDALSAGDVAGAQALIRGHFAGA
ncbi:FCD domain-containing protein [Streptomyces sp. NPDC047070]|uniref:FCD domain-containing protein n=1 Tax=Streptomyces sp. NPDC047070 TaxID=3154923 RepID=UPI00345113AA